MSFRGINTTVIQIRRQVFTEVARMAYANVKGEQANHLMRKIPYTIIPGEEGKLRKDIFLERAIVEERVRLAMGLPTRRMDEHNSVVSGLEDASIADKYYDPPLVNVIKFACNRCPEKLVKVSDLCQGCLAHPCMEVCPKKAITWESGRSIIDQDKCIKCGRCVGVCPYNAIVKTERPCAAACGMGAIHSDELGRAEIDYSKCVSCGQCLVNCPFGAIADKGQIYQLIQGFNRGDRIYALVAPAFINQFPSLASTGKLKAALKAIGFYDVVEVAIGADLCTVDEAHDFLEEVPGKLDFMATSCCPAWSMMAKTAFPALAKNISMTMTPMVFTARMMKQKDPTARMCFIGPCAAKKLEASRRTVRSDVDFVLTFEELAGIIEGKDLDIDLLEVDENEAALCSASAAGRGFAQSGGVAKAVADKQGWEVKYEAIDWDAKDTLLNSGAINCIWNGFTMEGREDDYTFSEPYMLNEQVLVVKKDAGIKSWDDLAGKTVITQTDSAAQDVLEGDQKDLAATFATLDTIGEYNTAFMQLESGAVDAVACDLSIAQYQLAAKPDAYTQLDKPLSSEHYAVGFKKGDTKSADAVTESLKALYEDGTVKDLCDKYSSYGLSFDNWVLK